MSFWSDFHFLRPLWLLVAFLAPIIFFLPHLNRKATSWDRVIEPRFLPYLLTDSAKKLSSKPFFLSLFLLLLALSLAGPTVKKIPNDIAFLKAPVIICLEVSEHMLPSDIDPNRLKRSIFKLEDLLKAYKGAEVALIAFAGDAHLVVPLSNDYNTVLTMAKTLSPDLMPMKGVNLASAMEMADEMTKKNPSAQIVVLTSSNFDDHGLKNIKPPSVPLVVWAFASPVGGPLPLTDGRFNHGRGGEVIISKLQRDYLAKLSEMDNVATLEFSPDSRDVDFIVQGLMHREPVRSQKTIFFDQWYDLGPYVLALAMLVFLGGVFLGHEWFFLVSLLFFWPSPRANAGVEDWFLRNEQKGEKALKNNQPEKAAELFKDDYRKGIAHFRAKNYDEALRHFREVDTSDSHYNAGNAFVQKKQYKEAIASYEQALKLDPKNDDARANKELLEKFQKEQQENQNKKDENKEKSSEEKDSSSSSKNEDQQSSSNQDKENSSPSDKPKEEKSKEKQESDEKSENSSDTNKDKNENKQDEKASKQSKNGAPKEEPLGEKLDPETSYRLQHLPGQNNGQFLRRKFLYETQTRQEGK